ncbi:MAG TPA: hypothetical protein VF099_12635 [Ktedonobacterales bacterium]
MRSRQIPAFSPRLVEFSQSGWQAKAKPSFCRLYFGFLVAIAGLPGAVERANVGRLLGPIQLHQLNPSG